MELAGSDSRPRQRFEGGPVSSAHTQDGARFLKRSAKLWQALSSLVEEQGNKEEEHATLAVAHVRHMLWGVSMYNTPVAGMEDYTYDDSNTSGLARNSMWDDSCYADDGVSPPYSPALMSADRSPCRASGNKDSLPDLRQIVTNAAAHAMPLTPLLAVGRHGQAHTHNCNSSNNNKTNNSGVCDSPLAHDKGPFHPLLPSAPASLTPITDCVATTIPPPSELAPLLPGTAIMARGAAAQGGDTRDVEPEAWSSAPALLRHSPACAHAALLTGSQV